MYYFAYGSNLNRKQMSQRCPAAKPLFKATLPNYRLIFARSPDSRHGVATIQRFMDEKVFGGIYEISEKDLKSLDRNEGYPSTYDRINVTVFNEDGEPLKVITYIKTDQSAEAKPSPEYLALIQQGYRDWGLR